MDDTRTICHTFEYVVFDHGLFYKRTKRFSPPTFHLGFNGRDDWNVEGINTVSVTDGLNSSGFSTEDTPVNRR